MQKEYDPADFWKPKENALSKFESPFEWECPYELKGYNGQPINFLEKEVNRFDHVEKLRREKRLCINGIIAAGIGIVATVAGAYILFPKDIEGIAVSLYDLFTKII